MLFLIDYEKKIIFGFSAKCGCTNIRKLFLSFTTNQRLLDLIKEKKQIYCGHERLPKNLDNFNIFIFIRNPYSRIVSGFFNKYISTHPYRNRWNENKNGPLTFSNFINELSTHGVGKVIERHHFTPQLSEHWENRLLKTKNVFFYDINNIDYENIADKCNITNITKSHEYKKKQIHTKNAFNIHIDKFNNSKPLYEDMYNDKLKRAVHKFYHRDFEIFKKLGFTYDI